MTLRIELHQINKQFGEFAALRNISGTIQEGDRISLVGHNGAGKSTLLNLIATLTHPSSGKINWYDGERELDKPQVRSRISYLSHEPMLYPDLDAMENLRFVARIYGISCDDNALLELLDKVGMKNYRTRLFRTCSRGMQQRLSLARALLSDPSLMLLDEPFSGLDTEGVARLKSLFTESTRSWVLVTHDPHQAYELANRFWILRRGKLQHAVARDELDYEQFLALHSPGGKT